MKFQCKGQSLQVKHSIKNCFKFDKNDINKCIFHQSDISDLSTKMIYMKVRPSQPTCHAQK